VILYGLRYDGTCGNHTVLADVGHHDGPIADPGITADRYARKDARLLAYRSVEPLDTMLCTAVDDRNVRAQQNIVLQCDIAQHTKRTCVDAPADAGGWVGNDRSECDTRTAAAFGEHQLVEGAPQINAG